MKEKELYKKLKIPIEVECWACHGKGYYITWGGDNMDVESQDCEKCFGSGKLQEND